MNEIRVKSVPIISEDKPKILKNPFSLKNVTKAYETLVKDSNYQNLSTTLSRPILTHYYIKIEPETFKDVDTVYKWDLSIHFSTIPVDFSNVDGKTVYRDPTIPDTKPTFIYGTIPKDKLKYFPSMVKYTILEEIFIPNFLQSQNAEGDKLISNSKIKLSKNDINKTNCERDLFIKTLEITDNLKPGYKLVSSKIKSKDESPKIKENIPSNPGDIICMSCNDGVYDPPRTNINLSFNLKVLDDSSTYNPMPPYNLLTYFTPVEKINLIMRLFNYDIDLGYTNAEGVCNFTMDELNYLGYLNMANNTVVLKYYLRGYDNSYAITNNSNDYLEINHTYYTSSSTSSYFVNVVSSPIHGYWVPNLLHCFRAAAHYYFGERDGLRQPPYWTGWGADASRPLKIRTYLSGDAYNFDVLRQFYGADAAIHLSSVNSSRFSPQQIYAVTIHELAHAAHWSGSRSSFLTKANKILESFAKGVAWYLTKKKYPNYFANIYKNFGTFGFAGIYRNEWYTNFIIDLIDGVSMGVKFYYTPGATVYYNDGVQGISISTIEQCAQDADRFFDFYSCVYNSSPNNSTRSNMYTLYNIFR
ncbi:MAG: hypothetical protein QM539_03745 [Alphaproteobacteria bacterium]|nr:hypothetical protein [Alphaproteobacteria bacterium]